MPGFTKLFGSIVTSSLWCQDDTVLRVWIGMLATSGPTGKVPGSVPGLANLCRVSIEDMERVLEILLSPDQYSRTPDNDGRRIQKCDGGWQLLNYVKYREMRDEGERKEYQRNWVKEKRCRQKVSTVDQCLPQSTKAEAEAEAEKRENSAPTPPEALPAASLAAPPKVKILKPKPKPEPAPDPTLFEIIGTIAENLPPDEGGVWTHERAKAAFWTILGNWNRDKAPAPKQVALALLSAVKRGHGIQNIAWGASEYAKSVDDRKFMTRPLEWVQNEGWMAFSEAS